MTLKSINHILFTLILCFSLFNSNFYIYPSQTAYFGFLVLSSLLIITTGGLVVAKDFKSAHSLVSWPVLLPILINFYLLGHALFINHIFTLRHKYLFICCLLFIALHILIKRVYVSLRTLCIIIGFVSASEAVSCFLQYYGLIESKNAFFVVTGTWVNPNVSAMFIALSVPAVLYLFTTSHENIKLLAGSFLCLMFGALLMLKCRTALLGALICMAIILQSRFNLIAWFKKTTLVSARFLLLFMGTGLIILVSIYIYQIKKGSSNGRELVWKVSMSMISEKPYMGYGYGAFEKNYNLAQAQYFSSGKGHEIEKRNASQVKMAYNEYLENAIEGGLVGLLLFVILLGSLLVTPLYFKKLKVRENNETSHIIKSGVHEEIRPFAYAGLFAFACMSLINFTIAAIPVMFLFLFFAATLTATGYLPTRFKINFNNNRVIGIFLIVSGTSCLYLNSNEARDHHKIKEASLLAKGGDIKKAFFILHQLSPGIQQTDSYCRTIGHLLIRKEKYDSALAFFKQASIMASSPEIYMQIGYCQMALKQYTESIDSYETALNIQPNRFAPRNAIMQIYLQQCDSTNALIAAREIIRMEPKIASMEVDKYKKEAACVIRKLSSIDQ